MVLTAYGDPLGFFPLQSLQQIDPNIVLAATRTASCSTFDPKLMPNTTQISMQIFLADCRQSIGNIAVWVHTGSTVPHLLSASHFTQLFLTIHRLIYDIAFGRALHSIKALLWLLRWRWQGILFYLSLVHQKLILGPTKAIQKKVPISKHKKSENKSNLLRLGSPKNPKFRVLLAPKLIIFESMLRYTEIAETIVKPI